MTTQSTVLTVSQLNHQVRSWLEHEIGAISVEGEMSNLSRPASGHLYFTLKDATAQLRCVYFRNRHAPTTNDIQNGQHVLAHGRLSLYEARGDYQLIVEDLQEAGVGDLYRQFELLKTKLAAVGLFDASRKRPLPPFPHVIGVITSESGAALHDILTTLERRFPVAHVLVYTSDVQGKLAAIQLINAINQANHDMRCDVLILARGGGSIEDLWAFNDERLAHTIANSGIPIVSGVGHETDFTIADFVADLRAATPTAAAVAVTPNRLELIALLQSLETHLITTIDRFVQHRQMVLDHAFQKVASPSQLIGRYWQSLDYLQRHLHHALQQLLSKKRHEVEVANAQLAAENPILLLEQAKSRLQNLEQGLMQYTKLAIQHCKQQFTAQLSTLHAMSPLATLDRGYAIATYQDKVLINSHSVNIGDVIAVRLANGILTSTIIRKE